MARTPGIFAVSSAGELGGVGVVAADDHVAVESIISIKKFRGQVVECCHHAHSLGHEFGGLLRG